MYFTALSLFDIHFPVAIVSQLYERQRQRYSTKKRQHLSSAECLVFETLRAPSHLPPSADKRSVSHFPKETRLRTRKCGLLFSSPTPSLLSDSVNRLNKNERDKVTPRAVSSENATTLWDFLQSFVRSSHRSRGIEDSLRHLAPPMAAFLAVITWPGWVR